MFVITVALVMILHNIVCVEVQFQFRHFGILEYILKLINDFHITYKKLKTALYDIMYCVVGFLMWWVFHKKKIGKI